MALAVWNAFVLSTAIKKRHLWSEGKGKKEMREKKEMTTVRRILDESYQCVVIPK